jgi:hypothetical protein
MSRRFAGKFLFACSVFLFAPRASAEPIAPPYDLFEVGPLEEPRTPLESILGDWALLHQEKRDETIWLLLALRDGARGNDLPGWGRPRYLGRVRESERVIYAAPEDGQERLRTGRPVTIPPSGGTVFVTRETPAELAQRAPHQFRVLERDLPSERIRPRKGPPAALAPLLERARGEGREDGAVRTLVGQVSIDSLETCVRDLAEKEPFGAPTSRYFASDETEIVHRLAIAQKFAQSLGPEAVSEHAFRMVVQEPDTITVHNIVARLAAAVPATGAILVTAHYDAIGVRSVPDSICTHGLRDVSSGCDCQDPSALESDPDCKWNWRTDPAPGADDNASGIAVLLEAARLLANESFEFDIYFVAFQGEELGLLGSAAFADSIASAGQEVLAVLNLDMVAYSLSRKQLDIVANENSEWLADFLLETRELFVPDLIATKYVEFFGRSDHASFWAVGIDAVLLIEDKRVTYPPYHTFQDTWEILDESRSNDQFVLAGQLVVGALARLSAQYEEQPDLAIPVRKVVVTPSSGSDLRVGSPALITTRVFNYGSSTLRFQNETIDSLTARVSVYDGDPSAGGRLLGQETRKTFFATGSFEDFETIWQPAAGQEGFHEIHAVVEGLDAGYDASELNSANNRTSSEVFVGGSVPRILQHYSYPNPLRESVSELNFSYDLTADASVRVSIFDLEGALLAEFFADFDEIDDGNRTGRNTIHGSQFRDSRNRHVEPLEPGVYLYSIRVLDGAGEVSDAVRGKFAVVR